LPVRRDGRPGRDAEGTMSTLVLLVIVATVGVPAVAEAAIAAQGWQLPANPWMAAGRFAVLSALVAMIGGLTAMIVSESADAAGYGKRGGAAPLVYNAQANPHYGFGPLVRAQATDVISGDRMIGRDPDPFIRGQMLRAYK
jgi:hypothetical protein